MDTITSLSLVLPKPLWMMTPPPRLQTALWMRIQSSPAGDAWLGPASSPSSAEIVSIAPRLHQVRHVSDVWCCLTMLWRKSHQTLLTCPHSCPLHLPPLHRGPRRPTLQLQAVHPGQPRPGLVWRPAHHSSPCYYRTRTRRSESKAWREWVSSRTKTKTIFRWIFRWIWKLHLT